MLIYEGPLLPKILDAVQQEKNSLVALCRGGPVNTRLMKKLLKKSPVPVIIFNRAVHDSGGGHRALFHHVIFATDWSPASKVAVEYFLSVFKEMNGILEIVNVINRRLSVRDIRELKRKLEGTRTLFLQMGIDAESHIYAGKPPEEVMLAAKDYSATTIVMGTSRKPFMKSIFSKGCAYQVATEAEVPALIIPSWIDY
ncbi:MAG: universal stress protein [Deltaproteobacteria bacterium]|nr:universal stress protein [Deltaproteobacteria bacterium]MBW2049053.1 universal stress protein [Deltaproteobacteria bacterium]MBW2111013.1 universal stress protein [Deltaproteobacteria bacterium]MBW2353184.1 universal stress protein [Deltaproteobacteria bacterium]